MKKKYRGISLLGNEKISAIYTVDEGIVDINGVGIYHFYYKDYSQDLIQSATTMIKIKENLYYGNKHHRNDTHHNIIRPFKTSNNEGYIFEDSFILKSEEIEKTDRVYAFGDNIIAFECDIKNNSENEIELEALSYVHFRNVSAVNYEYYDANLSYVQVQNKYLGIITENASRHYIYEDSPTDFSHLIQHQIIEGITNIGSGVTNQRLAMSIGKEIKVKEKEVYRNKFLLIACDSLEELLQTYKNINFEDIEHLAKNYWDEYFSQSDFTKFSLEELSYVKANLVAIKAANISGFIPADLTGHYYDKQLGLPCYYARDSLMVARAFLLSNHKKEAKEIITYLAERERNEFGEFFQRYNGMGIPNEGANNNVFHQIDSIGYFIRMILEFFKKYGELLVDIKMIKELVEVVVNSKSKFGMVGEEGGVNEGVFGPAYITSSNMFIYGGIKAALELFEQFEEEESVIIAKDLLLNLMKGIESTFNKELGRYDYGYVSYQENTVKKYDTPQYFGLLYGFEDTYNMRSTHKYLLDKASFYVDGIGYSQQEYHHGPWIFNTAACAEYSYLIGDKDEYLKKYNWMMEHTNNYLLLPEAIDANDESVCMINPLTWACAEFISASFIREEKND